MHRFLEGFLSDLTREGFQGASNFLCGNVMGHVLLSCMYVHYMLFKIIIIDIVMFSLSLSLEIRIEERAKCECGLLFGKLPISPDSCSLRMNQIVFPFSPIFSLFTQQIIYVYPCTRDSLFFRYTHPIGRSHTDMLSSCFFVMSWLSSWRKGRGGNEF